MKYIYLSILLTIGQRSISQDLSLFEKEIFKLGEEELPFRILYPEGYDKSKSYPLVLFLHGAGERGSDNEKQLTHGIKTFLDPVHRDQFPCIVLAPQCPSESYWSSAKIDRSSYPLDIEFNYENQMTSALNLALSLTHQIIEKEAIDKKRIYIAGLSMGGMGAFEAIYKEEDFFAAAAVVCGGGDINSYDLKQTSTAFWIFHGDEDAVVRVEYSRQMYNRLMELNAKVKYTEYQGVNHDSWDNAFNEKDLLEWMFSHTQ